MDSARNESVLFLVGTDTDQPIEGSVPGYQLRSEPPTRVDASGLTAANDDAFDLDFLQLGAVVPVAFGNRENRKFRGEVKSVRASGGAQEADVLLRLTSCPEPAPQAARRDESEPAPGRVAVHERIRGRQRIFELADALARNRSHGQLLSSHAAPMPVRAVHFMREQEALRWEVHGAVPPTPFVIEVTGYNSLYRIPVDVANARGGNLVTRLGSEVIRVRRRWRRRVTTTADHFVEFRHPLWHDVVVRRPLRDISHGGASFWSEPDKDLVYAGLALPEVLIGRTGEEPVRVAAEVRHVARAQGRCGLQVTPIGEHEQKRWEELVTRVMHPTTSTGSAWSEATWTLFERSGYFNLSGKDGDKFRALQQAYHRLNRRLDQAPNVGYHVVWPMPDGRDAQAAISILKVYAGSWFGYHMAKVTGDTPDGISGRRVLRDIHLRLYEHIQQDPNVRWVIGYPQVKRVWSRAVHYDLPARYTSTDMACVVRFRAIEVSTKARAEVVPTGDVGRANAEETRQMLERVAATRPRPYREALDLVPERVDLAENKRLWTDAKLERDRVILVARSGGRAEAAAVLEAAEEGSHLYRLLDLVRIYPLVEGGERHMATLLEAAKAWFRAKGRPAYVWYVDDLEFLPPTEIAEDMTDMGLADMSILSAELLPELLEHLCEVTSPRASNTAPSGRRLWL